MSSSGTSRSVWSANCSSRRSRRSRRARKRRCSPGRPGSPPHCSRARAVGAHGCRHGRRLPAPAWPVLARRGTGRVRVRAWSPSTTPTGPTLPSLRWLDYLARRLEGLPLLIVLWRPLHRAGSAGPSRRGHQSRAGRHDAPPEAALRTSGGLGARRRLRPPALTTSSPVHRTRRAEGIPFCSPSWPGRSPPTGAHPTRRRARPCAMCARRRSPVACSCASDTFPSRRRPWPGRWPSSTATPSCATRPRSPTGTRSRWATAADRLVAAGFLQPGRPLRFAHPLIRGVIYGDIAGLGAGAGSSSSRGHPGRGV